MKITVGYVALALSLAIANGAVAAPVPASSDANVDRDVHEDAAPRGFLTDVVSHVAKYAGHGITTSTMEKVGQSLGLGSDPSLEHSHPYNQASQQQQHEHHRHHQHNPQATPKPRSDFGDHYTGVSRSRDLQGEVATRLSSRGFLTSVLSNIASKGGHGATTSILEKIGQSMGLGSDPSSSPQTQVQAPKVPHGHQQHHDEHQSASSAQHPGA
ncbi:unnamed protein product [Sympodiomycopsis kandeliae]